MSSKDRVAFLAILWFVGWTISGYEIGKLTEAMPGTGAVSGFLFALVTIFAWPWILPDFMDRWLYEAPLDEPEPLSVAFGRHRWRVRSHTLLHVEDPVDAESGGHRVLVVTALWFAFWMMLGAAIGGYTSRFGAGTDGIYFGFFNGAWWALLTSFAWPWLMPRAIDRWMFRN